MSTTSIKEALARFRRWQRDPHYHMPSPGDEQHVCAHCGYSFEGNFCPNCGLNGKWQRFTARTLWSNFLDIWGLGNRPMHRSLRDLILRPGYMIRDYLSGGHLNYFPPFKMLAVLIVMLTLLAWAVGYEPESVLQNINERLQEAKDSQDIVVRHIHSVWNIVYDYLSTHELQTVLLKNAMLVMAMWIVFRKTTIPATNQHGPRRLGFVELFFVTIYINCQFLILEFLELLLFRKLWATFLFPYYDNHIVVMIILSLDFAQLFGFSFKKGLLKSILLSLALLLCYTVLFFLLLVALAITIIIYVP